MALCDLYTFIHMIYIYSILLLGVHSYICAAFPSGNQNIDKDIRTCKNFLSQGHMVENIKNGYYDITYENGLTCGRYSLLRNNVLGRLIALTRFECTFYAAASLGHAKLIPKFIEKLPKPLSCKTLEKALTYAMESKTDELKHIKILVDELRNSCKKDCPAIYERVSQYKLLDDDEAAHVGLAELADIGKGNEETNVKYEDAADAEEEDSEDEVVNIPDTIKAANQAAEPKTAEISGVEVQAVTKGIAEDNEDTVVDIEANANRATAIESSFENYVKHWNKIRFAIANNDEDVVLSLVQHSDEAVRLEALLFAMKKKNYKMAKMIRHLGNRRIHLLIKLARARRWADFRSVIDHIFRHPFLPYNKN